MQVLKNPLFLIMTFAVCTNFFMVNGVQVLILLSFEARNTSKWSTQSTQNTQCLPSLASPSLLPQSECSSAANSATSWYLPHCRAATKTTMLGKYSSTSSRWFASLRPPLLSVGCSYSRIVEQFYVFIVTLWIAIFAGAASLPAGIGIAVSCVEKKQQSACSSMSQLIYNMFG